MIERNPGTVGPKDEECDGPCPGDLVQARISQGLRRRLEKSRFGPKKLVPTTRVLGLLKYPERACKRMMSHAKHWHSRLKWMWEVAVRVLMY